jgi:hypothetical protein
MSRTCRFMTAGFQFPLKICYAKSKKDILNNPVVRRLGENIWNSYAVLLNLSNSQPKPVLIHEIRTTMGKPSCRDKRAYYSRKKRKLFHCLEQIFTRIPDAADFILPQNNQSIKIGRDLKNISEGDDYEQGHLRCYTFPTRS